LQHLTGDHLFEVRHGPNFMTAIMTPDDGIVGDIMVEAEAISATLGAI
jgi:hypothetical protein